MQLVLLADFELMKNPKLLPDAAKIGALGIGHHGNRTDERFRSGEKQKVKDFSKRCAMWASWWVYPPTIPR